MSQEVKYFALKHFDAQWAKASLRQKKLILEHAARLSPSKGIRPILTGLFYPDSQVELTAMKGLEALFLHLERLLSDSTPQALNESARVSAAIYRYLHPNLPEAQWVFLFKGLLETGGKGPGFAFMTLIRNNLPSPRLEAAWTSVSDNGRLALATEFIQAGPGVRHTHGARFKTILASIKSRVRVIEFYAKLFDRQQDADPFLHNIPAELRDPKTILTQEMKSRDPRTRAVGLKAMAMLSNRIPPKHLQACLTPDQPPEVRAAACAIIENAAMGTYASLHSTLLTLLLQTRDQESLAAFKALVMAGRQPAWKIFNTLHANQPALLPMIQHEISTLSKTGFIIIQDIALNKERYTSGIHLKINMAAAFGMMKKRPERVAHLLDTWIQKEFSSPEIPALKKNLTDLIEKEKQDISAQFSRRIAKERALRKELPPGLDEKQVETQLEHLTRTDSTRPLNFQGARLSCRNLSGHPSANLNFNFTTLETCNFSNTRFSTSSFTHSIIINGDMTGARFHAISFDHAILINVKARGAVFENCSFQSAAVYNCDFTDAQIRNTSFIDAIISGSGFDKARVSFSSFAFAMLSSVKLDTTRMEQVDLSHVKARFSRFPQGGRGICNKQDIHYNVRRHQISFSQIPELEPPLIRQINLLTFCEFTHYGEDKFLKQNQLSLSTAYDIFTPKQADLFKLIPLLLHENCDFPFMDPNPASTPCGIASYIPSEEARRIFTAYAGDAPHPGKTEHAPAIKGVFTIGSVGSIAQTEESDIDYWVCIRQNEIEPHHLDLLKKKLTRVEKMAKTRFHTQVTFFIVDVDQVRANKFGASSAESSGTAQAGLLKEEFYRTMIHVAGKIPLWAVLPTAVSQHYYDEIAARIGVTAALNRYLDLGDIHQIPTGEYFGASIWQMFKWIKSPFKSILKMALLEKYLSQTQDKTLLCTLYKDEWMNTGATLKLAQNDSYYFLMKHLLHYYRSLGDEHSINLLLTCFFLKLGITSRKQIEDTPLGLRKILLFKCLETWQWDIQKVFNVGNFRTWPYKNIERLSSTLERHIQAKYKKIKQRTDKQSDLSGPLISTEDQTILEHKIDIAFSDTPEQKVRKRILVSRGDQHFSRLYLKCIGTDTPCGRWALFNQAGHADKPDELILKAKSIEEIGTWLVVNELFSSRTDIDLLSNPFGITKAAVNTLFQKIYLFFTPQLSKPVPSKQLLIYPEKKQVFVSVNFYAPQGFRLITHYIALYTNAWNEMFCQIGHADRGFISMDHVKRDLMFTLRTRHLPEKTQFYPQADPK